ncbi:hypothetical protein GCM10022393_01530 [Aquimarina addita]|uniref:GLPGLI family protein n=1 Tax=Aquimarina addita TaxID=870485 RepID=A0ABP7X7T5_9FLAO
MKTIKIITTILLIFSMSNSIAQEKQVESTTTVHTFNFEKDGKTIPYRIKVHKKVASKVKLAKEDADKLNQARKATSDQVTKLIYVDNDEYDDYDKYIVLKYMKDPTDSFELKPTKRGFSVLVDNKNLEYIFGEGIYFVNNEDADFFIVEEFDAI